MSDYEQHVETAAEAIWTASRADEGTISATGAKIVARAALAAVYDDILAEHKKMLLNEFRQITDTLAEALGYHHDPDYGYAIGDCTALTLANQAAIELQNLKAARDAVARGMAYLECGGCQGLGAHRRHCPHNPDYTPWRELADKAETLGDRIGSNDMGAANRCYAVAGRMRARHDEELTKRATRQQTRTDVEDQ